ncbi:N-6 DNA methylase [Breznakibacter xylanolyticus]|uniref:site-specific DNA-methyltransferase (adenine-specific) n=1 Tax=Breznakibacter xylanolyticus TaxID=990 RepID=A0A2W7MPZ8_9BACT|nr:TaqI-like C-terminal specificity domain-containing protein [Breznakibacter xylanolyticus]PZX10275.1 N-6 DNA methylase [Breznakibacter xylanolyticus]
MGLFQKTVVQKYLKQFDAKTLENKYNEFIAHFGKPEIQENIRNSKEEQYQEGFLRDLFVNILGYTLNPNTNYNLITENKNLKDSKKADGAIILESKVKAVIELKGTDTTDLAKVENQAFGYKNNQIGCVYVITSNFEKLRFYIEDATNFEEFNLFTLTHEQFNLFYLCLSFDSISKGLPLAIKHESTSKEEQITNDFYKAYSTFKRDLYQNLVSQNPQFDPLLLFKKSQKLLDRFLFLFFAEDRLLLPPNSVRLILSDWRELQERDVQIPLYERYKKYFEYLNTGYKGKRYDVFAYNGGLFKPDEVLDTVTINDDLLYKHTLKLSEYDFVSEVDVNILGHIFENSLNEIDEIKAELEGTAIDKTKTKRKKDGVFYTPKYITKYIVENTVGKLCTDKKNEIGIKDEDYITDKKRQTNTKKALLDKLAQYRQWLLQITICDPACGSGAFLNQALDFLITEHQYIDELQAKIYGASIIFSDVEKSILENNIYGVDLNEESVEIAKLSLWLRTAQPNRKLNDLNNNIKCGNSLIDEQIIAGEKAFNWQTQFPEIFDKGGFDIIIGNPPYVLCQPSNTNEIILNYYKSFEVSSYKIDLFHLFYEKSIKNLKEKGLLGFITPNTFLTNKYIQSLRNFILCNSFIEQLVNYNDVVFVDAGVDVATLILSKNKILNSKILVFNSINGFTHFNTTKSQQDWLNSSEQVFNINNSSIMQFENCIPFEEIGNTYFGIQAYDRKSSISSTKDSDIFIPIIDGSDVFKYKYSEATKYFNFIEENIKSGGDWEIYKKDRIVIRQIGQFPIIGFCNANILTSNTIYNLYLKDENYSLKYVFTVLNSKVIKSFWLSSFSDNKDLFPKIKGYQLKQLPIPKADKNEQQPLIEKADLMLSLNKELQVITQRFTRLIQRKFNLNVLSTKVHEWHLFSFNELLKELAKKKIKLSLSDEAEWENYFLQESKIALELKSQIEKNENEIDHLVYQLYKLTNDQIEIIENSVK